MPDLILPEAPEKNGFNPKAVIPFGVTTAHIRSAMGDFVEFLSVIDTELQSKGMATFENTIMQASFSGLVGEFVAAAIAKYCKTIVKNVYHNGHPDMLPAGKYPDNKAQHAGNDGIEVKASRYLTGWQGHNEEDAWLMVFVFQSGRIGRKVKETTAFKFLLVAGAMLKKEDWNFSGRKKKSRRTITASVKPEGAVKMKANWIYKSSDYRAAEESGK